jgi:metal-responsive CopG/Arc/MetJ family transcriptional regulator
LTVAKVAVSLEPELLARVDAAAEAAGQSRSAFVRHSLEYALRTLEEERAVREARAIYGEIERDESLRQLHDAFSSVAGETLPPFEPDEQQAGPPSVPSSPRAPKARRR